MRREEKDPEFLILGLYGFGVLLLTTPRGLGGFANCFLDPFCS